MHGHEAGGINAGALVLALPLVVLGLILFFQKTAAPAVSAVLVVGGLLVGAAGFTFLKPEPETHQHEGTSAEGSDYGDMMVALCEARELPPTQAGELFLDRAHGPLHLLADELATEDRAAAGELLEAKQNVEHALEGSAHEGSLRESMEGLAQVTAASLTTLDVEVEACV